LLALLGLAAGLSGVACNAAQGWSVKTGLPFAPMQRWIAVCAAAGAAAAIKANHSRAASKRITAAYGDSQRHEQPPSPTVHSVSKGLPTFRDVA
jgi:hypothetical protein